MCLRNARRLGVLNGTAGRVVAVSTDGLMLATSEGERHLPIDYLKSEHVSHAYAMTVHKAQGATVERSYVLATEALTKEAGYVALSRAKTTTELFVPLRPDVDLGHDQRRFGGDDLAALVRRLATSRGKQMALLEFDGAQSVDRERGVAPGLG